MPQYPDFCDVAIIGAGPAGLFAALELIEFDPTAKIVVFEAGVLMADRFCPRTRECDCSTCDILEGVGGAGGFSDGKQTLSLGRGTQTESIFDLEKDQDILGMIDKITVQLGESGEHIDGSKVGSPGFLRDSALEFESYPLRHIGSDGVRAFIHALYLDLRWKGVQFITDQSVHHLCYQRLGNRVSGVVYDGVTGYPRFLGADKTIIATGLQGSEWVRAQMEALDHEPGRGPAGIGIRLEAPSGVLEPLFSWFYDWKASYRDPITGITIRSFCCNHEGEIVNENHKSMGIRNVNGHSFLSEDKRTGSSNFAMLAKIDSSLTDNPQEYVRGVAHEVNSLVGGHTVVQRASDFLGGTPTDPNRLKDMKRTATNLVQSRLGPIHEAMPSDLLRAFQGYLRELRHIIPGLCGSSSSVYAPEVKYYAPKYKVDSFSNWKVSGVSDLYMIGNANGFIDSFNSAAVTGVQAARHIQGRG